MSTPITETLIKSGETENPITETPIKSGESEKKKMLILRTSDNEEFEVEQSIAIQSRTIKNLVEDVVASTAIPIPNVDSETLTKVIEYLKGHADSKDGDLKEFNKKFVKTISDSEENLQEIFALVLAANYLDIPGLLDATTQYVADFIKDKPVEEVREIFNVVNDFTPEEEANIRNEHSWAFE